MFKHRFSFVNWLKPLKTQLPLHVVSLSLFQPISCKKDKSKGHFPVIVKLAGWTGHFTVKEY